MARAMFMAAHLVNTFVLIACLTLTAWWLSRGARLSLGVDAATGLVALGAGAILVTGTSGAVAALGDTLFPAESMSAGLTADLSATSHVLIRLRILHPALAIATAVVVTLTAVRLALDRPRAERMRAVLLVLICAQLGAGFANVLWLAPVWLQLVHLLFAHIIWITYVVLAAESLSLPAKSVAITHAA
jgi:heme A synthase